MLRMLSLTAEDMQIIACVVKLGGVLLDKQGIKLVVGFINKRESAGRCMPHRCLPLLLL